MLTHHNILLPIAVLYLFLDNHGSILIYIILLYLIRMLKGCVRRVRPKQYLIDFIKNDIKIIIKL